MQGIIVAGTGTDIGKTYVSALLIRQFLAKGQQLTPVKPVMSGFDPAQPEISDMATLLEAAGLAPTDETIARYSPWRFRLPLAPPMAATRDGIHLTMQDIISFCHTQALSTAPLLIETAGGVMSPLAEDGTCLDLIAALDWPVVLVCGSYLGAISHTLTALEALKSVRPAKLIVMNESPQSAMSTAETILALQRYSGFAGPIAPLSRCPLDVAATQAHDLTQYLSS